MNPSSVLLLLWNWTNVECSCCLYLYLLAYRICHVYFIRERT